MKWSVGVLVVVGVVVVLVGVAQGAVHPTLAEIADEGFCERKLVGGFATGPEILPGHLASNLNLTWITTIPKFYISYGSVKYWLQNGEGCLGQEPLFLALLTDMQQSTRWDLNSTTTCFGRSITQQCALNKNNGNPFAACRVTEADSGTKPSVYANFKKRVVLTDNNLFALFVRCAGGKRSYYIVSPFPSPLPQNVLIKCILKIIELGFNPALFYKNPNRETDSFRAPLPLPIIRID